MPQINDSFTKALPIPKTGNKIHWDNKVSGLGIRITTNGTTSFVFRYRINGNQRIHTIGKYPSEVNCTSARAMASELKANVFKGIDPLKKNTSLLFKDVLK